MEIISPGGGGLSPALTLRSTSTRCAYCRRKRRRGAAVNIACDRCGAAMHDRCYFKWVGVGERFRFEATDEPVMFLCHGCRS